jgi:hypothetical protein
VASADQGRDPAAPAQLYLVLHHDLNALKLGITGEGTGRVHEHRQQGWELVCTYALATAADAAWVEAQVIAAWRAAGYPPGVDRAAMPQTGWTETVSQAHVDVPAARRQLEAVLADERRRRARAAAPGVPA